MENTITVTVDNSTDDVFNIVSQFCIELNREPEEVYEVVSLNEHGTKYAVLFNDHTYIIIELIAVDKSFTH